MEIYLLYNFSNQDWYNIPNEEKNCLIQER